MGRIKSALEIALERTETVKGDRSSIGQFEARQQGKKIANGFLEDPGRSIDEELKKVSREQRDSLRQGIFDVLISQITLPLNKDEEKRITTAGKGLEAIINNKQFSALYKQFSQMLAQYLDEAAQYDEAIRRQYAPKLRQKEEELSRRMGREIRLDPFQDPEFIAFYNQNMNALKGNYQAAVDQVQAEAQRLFEEK
jgi:pyruvate-formate lyase